MAAVTKIGNVFREVGVTAGNRPRQLHRAHGG